MQASDGPRLLRAGMSPSDVPPHIQDRIAELREQILHHDDLYYGLGTMEISDSEYDKLFKELQDLEEQYPGLITWSSLIRRRNGLGPRVLNDSNIF